MIMLRGYGKAKVLQYRSYLQIMLWMKPLFFMVTLVAVSVLTASPAIVLAEGSPAIVHIDGSARPPGFSPSFQTIHEKTSVTFINDSYPPASYTIVAKDGSFSSPTLAPSQQWTITLNSPGNYEYTTKEAPTQMLGDLIVVDPSAILIPTPNPTTQAVLIDQIKHGGDTQPTHSTSQSQSGLPIWAFIVLAVLFIGCIASLIILLRIRSKRLRA
jgi:plastocyanin